MRNLVLVLVCGEIDRLDDSRALSSEGREPERGVAAADGANRYALAKSACSAQSAGTDAGPLTLRAISVRRGRKGIDKIEPT